MIIFFICFACQLQKFGKLLLHLLNFSLAFLLNRIRYLPILSASIAFESPMVSSRCFLAASRVSSLCSLLSRSSRKRCMRSGISGMSPIKRMREVIQPLCHRWCLSVSADDAQVQKKTPEVPLVPFPLLV